MEKTPPFDSNAYRLLFEAAPHPYLVLEAGPAFTILAVNEHYLAATGTRREVILGHGLFEIFPDDPGDVASSSVGDLRSSLNRVLADRRADTMGVQKYDIPRRDGSGAFEVKYWSPVNTPVFDGAGAVTCIIHHVEDVTEFILGREQAQRERDALGKVEAAAGRAEAEVLHRATEVKEANRALKTALEDLAALNDRLKELDRLRSDFFANISHELRTPLTLILGPLERRLRDPALEPGLRSDLQRMERNGRILLAHVNDLLDLARLDSGAMGLRLGESDLAALARLELARFESLARERRIGLHADLPASLPAQVDAEKVRRILANLLANAIKFTPAGGGIRVALEAGAGEAALEVRDSGPGIPEELREVVFDRFRQVESGPGRATGGTGLGLAIVKAFCGLHRGAVTLDRAPEGGARFRVTLPLLAPEGAQVEAASAAAAPEVTELLMAGAPRAAAAPAHANAPRLLVVDDNPDMRDFLVSSLAEGYRVTAAAGGAEALALALADPPDLVLSDVMMPGMTGDQLVEQLRARPETEDVPVVLLTAKAEEPLRVRMLRLGVADYLLKPFSLDQLLARVAALVEQGRKARLARTVQETRFQATFEQAAVGMAHVAPDGRWLRVNQRLCDILGHPRAELLAGSAQDLTLAEDLDADLARLDQLLRGECASSTREKRYLRGDGTLTWVNRTVSLVRDPEGRPDYLILVAEDINARKAAERALRDSEAFLKDTQRLAELGSWQWDQDSGRHTWSEEIFRIYGRDPALPAADFQEVQAYFTPESWARLGATVEAALAQGLPYQCDAEVLRPDGGHRWITARGEALLDAHGTVRMLQGTVQDITTRRLQEMEIQRLQSDLERRVVERTAELQAANAELESFSYAVSHDLRAPLRAMGGFSQALLEDLGPALPALERTYLDQIVLASARMSDLIDGILQLSRATRGELRRERVDLSALADRIRADLERTEPERRVEWDLAPDLRAWGDPRQLEALLRNLLQNAWKYSSAAAPARIAFTAEGPGRFRVSDNGAGFDMDHAAKLFQPFQRLHRQEEFPGLGIGLATVRRIIQRHGGGIEARGEPGRGATFLFTLPEPEDEENRP